MNTTTPNTPHCFDLAGMKVGDWFLGCPQCWNQYPPRAAGTTKCHCGGTMLIYDIKPHNAAELAHHNRLAAQIRRRQ